MGAVRALGCCAILEIHRHVYMSTQAKIPEPWSRSPTQDSRLGKMAFGGGLIATPFSLL